MGKNNGGSSSWLSAVKKAFRSPSKDKQNSDKRSCRSEDLEQQEQEKVIIYFHSQHHFLWFVLQF